MSFIERATKRTRGPRLPGWTSFGRSGTGGRAQAVEVLPGDKVVSTTTTGQPVTSTAHTLVINKANISNLAIGKPAKATEMTWSAPITFVYNDGSNADAVAAVIEYSVNGGKAIFLGFRIVTVAKQ